MTDGTSVVEQASPPPQLAAGDALNVHNAVIEYGRRTDQRVLAVDQTSFSVQDGEFVALVGPSGCGKTSIMKAVAGLVPLKSGSVVVGGAGHGAAFSMVFQTPSLLPWRTVIRNVSYGMEQSWRQRARAKERCREVLRLVGLADFENAYPSQLSGGMRHRVNLARALAVDPAILLMDEPFSSLDAQLRQKMQEELVRLWQEAHTTALLVTHQVEEAVFLSDRVLVMSARPGRIKREFVVDLPRPRTTEMKQSDRFHELERAIWAQLDLTI